MTGTSKHKRVTAIDHTVGQRKITARKIRKLEPIVRYSHGWKDLQYMLMLKQNIDWKIFSFTST